jgi:hypothetical protein
VAQHRHAERGLERGRLGAGGVELLQAGRVAEQRDAAAEGGARGGERRRRARRELQAVRLSQRVVLVEDGADEAGGRERGPVDDAEVSDSEVRERERAVGLRRWRRGGARVSGARKEESELELDGSAPPCCRRAPTTAMRAK